MMQFPPGLLAQADQEMAALRAKVDEIATIYVEALDKTDGDPIKAFPLVGGATVIGTGMNPLGNGLLLATALMMLAEQRRECRKADGGA